MKQLLLNDFRNCYIYQVLVVGLFIANEVDEFRVLSMLLFASLFITYNLIKDNHKIWMMLLYDTSSLRKIVIAKILVSTFFTFLLFSIFSFSLNENETKFLYTLSLIYLICFILYTYVIPDGYVNVRQINLLQFCCVLGLYLCCYYYWQWLNLFIFLASYMNLVVILVFVFTIFLCNKTMPKIITHQIALDIILKDNQLFQEILFENKINHIQIDDYVFDKIKNPHLIYFLSILNVIVLQIQLELIMYILTVVFELYVLSLFLGILILFKTIFLFSDCKIRLKKIGCKR